MRAPEELLQEVIREAAALGIPVSRRISRKVAVSTRMTSTLGSCRKTPFGGFEIRIAARVLAAGEDAVKQVLCHEVLHTCRGCQNHGALWKRYAVMMEQAYGYRIRRTVDPQDIGVTAPEPKYILQCQRCGNLYKRQRECSLTRRPWAYRCRCGGALKLIKRPAG